MVSTVSRSGGKSSLEEKSPTICRKVHVSFQTSKSSIAAIFASSTLLSKPFIPDKPRASWNEWILNLDLYAVDTNWSWIFWKTSPLTSNPLSAFLFGSFKARRAKLDAISAHPAYVLPRCGVPRKMISFVRFWHDSDLQIACQVSA